MYRFLMYYCLGGKEETKMTISDTVKGLLAMCGKRQIELAAHFGMSKQTMSNKMTRNGWFGNDLVRVADFCGCKLAFIMPNGQQIIIEDALEEKKTAPGD